MLQKTKGIVLHRFKYSDTSIIANIYTEKFGKQAYIIYATKSKKGKSKINILQPAFILDLQVYHKKTEGLQKIKEFSIAEPYTSIPYDIKKSTISMFLSEVLYKTLKENEQDTSLFNFLQYSFQILDVTEKSINNFHTLFLLKLCKFMGISPQENFSDSKKTFNMTAGRFITGIPLHKNYLPEYLSEALITMFSVDIANSHHLQFGRKISTELLNNFLIYFNIHLGTTRKINSLEIFREVFS